MIHAVVARTHRLPVSAESVIAAIRCWRSARDAGKPVQQSLHAMLSPHDRGMLAPVFDSVMTLCETAFGRGFVVGAAARLSDDEHLLLDLLDGSRLGSASITCGDEMASALDCAIRSTRIMLALAAGAVPSSQPPTPAPRVGTRPKLRGKPHDQRSPA